MKDWASLLPFVLIVLVFWFLVVRPARRQQQKLAATQSAVRIGSEVMLGSGIYGTVSSIGDETLELEVAPGTRMKVAKQAVVRVVDAEQRETHGEHRPAGRDLDGPAGLTDSPGSRPTS